MSGPTASIDEQSGNGSGERERLGRFTLLRVLGRGASATVYEAMDTRMERPVALKVLSFDPLPTPEQRQRQIDRFEREARAVARLSHPNIVSVFDVGEAAGKHFLVMELLSGVTLRERIEQGGPIALGEAAAIVEQIAGALDCTHAEGIVHRDIKPSNVLLMPDGRIKMLDFGIARRGEDATVTHAGMLIGSPAYMSPEQGRGESASPASDIWSLGALLYEMLTGQSPFGASNVAAVLYNAAYNEPQPLPEDVSRAQTVVDHALAKQPEERYASAGGLANALRVAVDFPSGPGAVKSADATALPGVPMPALRSAGIGDFGSSSAQTTTEVQGTMEVLRHSRSRIADVGVIAAWAAVVLAALGIVTVRMRQSPAPDAPTPGAKSSPAAVANSDPLPVDPIPRRTPRSTRLIPPPAPSPPAVQITKAKPAPLPPVVRAAPVATPTPSAAPLKPVATPSPLATIKVTRTTPVPASRPKPVTSTKAPVKKPALVAEASSAEPPWDSRRDRLGDPEPEPTPTKTPAVRRPRQNRQSSMTAGEAASNKPLFRPSVLLGRWQGNIWKRNATLFVQNSDSDSFQGIVTLKTEKGPLRFNVQGSFSPVTGRLSFWSSGTPARALAAKIDLGQENGRLLSAKTMGGIGVDSSRRVFTWSFSR